MTVQAIVQERLIDNETFQPELTGYAASAAAAELVYHWGTSAADEIPLEMRLSDIDETIAALREWRGKVKAGKGGDVTALTGDSNVKSI